MHVSSHDTPCPKTFLGAQVPNKMDPHQTPKITSEKSVHKFLSRGHHSPYHERASKAPHLQINDELHVAFSHDHLTIGFTFACKDTRSQSTMRNNGHGDPVALVALQLPSPHER